MKKIIFALMGLAMLSCENRFCENILTELDGKQGDTIKTSVDTVTLTADNTIAKITTEGGQWFITSLEVDGQGVAFPGGFLPGEEQPQLDFPSGFNVEYGDIDGFRNDYRVVTEISCEWITITRTLQEISITATDSKIDKSHTFKLQLEDRNYFESITITRE